MIKGKGLEGNYERVFSEHTNNKTRSQSSSVLEEELMVWAEDEASHSIPYRKPGPEQGPSLFHLWKLGAARKWQKKCLMLAEGGSRGLRGEAISMT